MSTGTIDLMERGMSCLIDGLGIVDAEKFIAFVIREKFDYTTWQREHFDLETHFAENAVKYASANPIKFKKI